MKTLIVEDDFASRRMMQLMLASYGECDIAVNGEEALQAFRLAAQEGRRYDLICLDIMMPRLDGHSVLKEIRRMEEADGVRGRSGAKIIMTTALSHAKDIIEAFNEQCEAYLVKPIERQKLLSQIQALGLLEDQQAAASDPGGSIQSPAMTKSMQRVLVIDDDDQLRMMMRRGLERAGYAVADAPNGKVGLQLNRQQPADLIITDIFMPEKEGLETIRELKSEFPDAKIIAVSGGSGKTADFSALPHAKKFGALRVLSKPFGLKDLVMAVTELLETQR
jgi:two-component system chemotaxis response regulator CheY